MSDCLMEGCDRPSRARGYCDTHYRQVKYGYSGENGRPSMDGTVWKVRIRNTRGSQPYYFSDREQAFARANAAMHAGTLMFFAEYELKERFV